MLKTLENEVSKQAAPPALQAEFAQHDFEKLRNFCRITYVVSILIWLLFDLIVSIKGGQGFTLLSMVFIVAMAIITIVLGFIRKARHFHALNVLFVLVISVGIRLITFGLPIDAQPIWLALASSSILYSAPVLPLSRSAFITGMLITGVVLNPFIWTNLSVFDLRGSLILSYLCFLCGLTLYCYFTLRRVKLYNYTMSKLLVGQAYLDALTEIPNRRSFMTRAGLTLKATPRNSDHYLAMIDIDNFKKVNDLYGHDIGDEVLIRTAASIKAVMVDYEYARLGGEEFAVYLSTVQRDDVQKMMATLCRQVREDTHAHPVTISIGITRVTEGETLNQALAKADVALYASKHNGKDQFTFYS